MFDFRLLKMVPSTARYIVADVILQWFSLLANIVFFVYVGSFLQVVWRGLATAQTFVDLALISVFTIAVRLVCQTGAQRMGQAAAAHAKIAVRRLVYEKLVRLGPSYSEHVATAEAMQISVDGVEQLEAYFGGYMPQFFYALLASCTLFVALAPLCLPAAILLLVLIPLIPLSIMAVMKLAKRVMRSYMGTYIDLGKTFLESIQGLTTLKIYSADKNRHAMMNEEAEGFRKATMSLLVMQLNSITIMDLFAFGGAAAGIIVMLCQARAGNVSFAQAFTFSFLAADFFIPLRSLGSLFHTSVNGAAAAERMYAILDLPEPVGGTRSIDPTQADIVCRNLGYSYDGQRQVLKGVDLEVKHGSFVGITGESGSGKSTIAGILSASNERFSGEVTIAGVALRDISRASLRACITYVPSSSFVFEGTVRSNLKLAKPNASDEDLWRVLQACQLDGFVRASGGLDMQLSSEATNISGGQRQRLVMARALLHDTAVYIFDEATSNIDAPSEAAILHAITELARTKTVIMISHRLSALRDAACIYVIEDGSVIEQGTHDALLDAGGTYARLWDKQAQLESLVCNDQERCAAEVDEEFTQAHSVAETSIPSEEGVADGTAESGEVQARMSQAQTPQTRASQARVRKRTNPEIMGRLVTLTKPLLPFMIAAIILGVLGFCAAIFLTVFAVYGILNISGAWRVVSFTTLCVLVAICGILRGPLRYGEQLCNHYLAFRILALVRDKVFGALRKLAPAKLEGHNKADLIQILTSDIELLEVFYAHTLSPAAIALIVSCIMVGFIASQAPYLAPLAAVAYLTIGVVIPFLASSSMGNLGMQTRTAMSHMNGFVLESLRGLSETLQFGRSTERLEELRVRNASLSSTERHLKTRTSWWGALTAAVVFLFDVIVLLTAMIMVEQGTLIFGKAVLAVCALMSSFGPVIALANLGSTLQQTLAAGERVLDILDEIPQVEEVACGAEPTHFTGASASRVDFGYGELAVLHDIDLAIQPGSVVRIAGKSGSGKSTLLKLFMRFWDPNRGVVQICDHDIREVRTDSLRSIEDFMTQDTYLFSDTIRNNLLIARPLARDEELLDALEKAALSDYIERLPAGLDTTIAELGGSLSGGERQRLGLARIFLHDAQFVLLDEPTSNLDALNEAAVLHALKDNRADKTIIIVSHRESAASIADITYSVDRGRLC